MRYIARYIAATLLAGWGAAHAIADEFLPMVIKVSDDEEVAELREAGAEILRRRGDILLCFMPQQAAEAYGAPGMHGSRGPQKGRDRHPDRGKRYREWGNVPALDMSVGHYGASGILTGDGFNRTFTGKGVVVGICDIGFDPLHPTFLDENGRSRVKRITQYKESEGLRLVLEGDSEYEEWETDDADEYHATHVAGIIGGGGAGSPYAGIARDADIVVSTSTLSDVGLLAGVEDIIDYAREAGKPAVINLSMGNYIGAHDGSSLFSQYLDLCAEDAVIVLSAGNEGNQRNTLQYTFPASGKPVSFRLGNRQWDQIEMYGQTDIWSGSDRPVTVRPGIYTDHDHRLIYQYPEVALADGEETTITWNPETPDIPGLPLDGNLRLQAEVNRENGRYHVGVTCDFSSPELVEGKTWAKYTIALEIAGQPGESVDVFADGSRIRLVGMADNPAPGAMMSISDLACGLNVVSVGMYGNRRTWPVSVMNEAGETLTIEENTGYEPRATVVHSSYGTLRDGRALPLTVAPGAPLVSAFNRRFLEKHPDDEPYLKLDAPWIAMTGTSMSSPYVAGFIATWLEADPTLDSEEVIRLISETNITDTDNPEDPRNANGWFDPAAAMRKLIESGSVGSIADPWSMLRPTDEINIYTTDGRIVYSGTFGNMPDVDAGLYIVRTPLGSAPCKLTSK